jgi:hypothetical protein
MTIGERLDRLPQRHEALTPTVELLAQTSSQHDKYMTQIMEGIARLLHIAEIREQRIHRLQGDQS